METGSEVEIRPRVGPSQLQRAGYRVGQALTKEAAGLELDERRELFVQTIAWSRNRVAEIDEARRRAAAPVLPERVAVEFGKGRRSSDALDDAA